LTEIQKLVTLNWLDCIFQGRTMQMVQRFVRLRTSELSIVRTALSLIQQYLTQQLISSHLLPYNY